MCWVRPSTCQTAAWRTLTLRWAVFFLVLAVLNEYVWRTMSEETWVNFKVFGLMGLTMVFALPMHPSWPATWRQRMENHPQTDEWLHRNGDKSQDL